MPTIEKLSRVQYNRVLNTMDTKTLLESFDRICPKDQCILGFASLQGLLPTKWDRYPFGISIARKLDDSIIDAIDTGPTIEYHDLYHAVNRELNEITAQIVSIVKEAGIEAVPIPATVNDQDLDAEYYRSLRYTISHKMVATRSGIGWIGKTDLLVTHRFGPRVRLSSVLLSTPLGSLGIPMEKSLCRSCMVCVELCPAQAANGTLWDIHKDRDEFFDPFLCREYCRKISALKLGKDTSICGLCISVCPRGKS